MSSNIDTRTVTGLFYILYDDDSYTQTVYKTPAMAKRAYNQYAKHVEHNVKEYGWEVEYGLQVLSEPMTLSAEIDMGSFTRIRQNKRT